jgi:hypothetical protein
MRDHYDFSGMKGTRNPYIGRLKESITIRLDRPTVEYFKALAAELGMPYQSLINLYLRDCVVSERKLKPRWVAARGKLARIGRAGRRKAVR